MSKTIAQKKLKKIKKLVKKELQDENIDLKFIVTVDSKSICSLKVDFTTSKR